MDVRTHLFSITDLSLKLLGLNILHYKHELSIFTHLPAELLYILKGRVIKPTNYTKKNRFIAIYLKNICSTCEAEAFQLIFNCRHLADHVSEQQEIKWRHEQVKFNDHLILYIEGLAKIDTPSLKGIWGCAEKILVWSASQKLTKQFFKETAVGQKLLSTLSIGLPIYE